MNRSEKRVLRCMTNHSLINATNFIHLLYCAGKVLMGWIGKLGHVFVHVSCPSFTADRES
jgi:hypothetical protein